MSVLFHPAARPLELGYLSPHNPFDRRAFSGTSFFAAQALATHPGINLRILGPHRAPRRSDRWLRRTPPDVRIDEIDTYGLDAVLGLAATPLMTALADRRPDLPLVHVTDATPAFLRQVYGWQVPREADHRETRLVSQAAATVYSSPEMAARAPGDLGLPGLAPLAQPFGVNFESLPATCPEKPSLERLNLLFVGLDWTRKGGDVAVRALDLLRAAGRAAELTLVGKPPPGLQNHPGVQVAGFLDKNRPRDAARLTRLFSEAHLLVLPSRADCTPMVVAEAMAHGTPVLSTETGGLTSLLGGPGAGRTLPPGAPPEVWADAIRALTDRADAYVMLSDTAFDRASTALSWQSWAERMHQVAWQAQNSAVARAGAA